MKRYYRDEDFPNRKIEDETQLVKWATQINNGLGNFTNAKPDYQDLYAHSSQADIDRIFVGMKNDRRLVVQSVFNCMAYDEVERLLLVLYKHKANKIINDELERAATMEIERTKKIRDRESVFEESKRAIHRKIRELKRNDSHLRRVNAELLSRIEKYREETWAANRHANEYERDAKKYYAIKAALA